LYLPRGWSWVVLHLALPLHSLPSLAHLYNRIKDPQPRTWLKSSLISAQQLLHTIASLMRTPANRPVLLTSHKLCKHYPAAKRNLTHSNFRGKCRPYLTEGGKYIVSLSRTHIRPTVLKGKAQYSPLQQRTHFAGLHWNLSKDLFQGRSGLRRDVD
jgi:hypothetical protein